MSFIEFLSKKRFLAAFLFLSLFFRLSAQQTEFPDIFRYRLDNGLELFVIEDHTNPLVTIDISVRCGSIAQTKQTAGLFHLYEHMIFNGNELYETTEQMENALNKLGVYDYNAYTGFESLSYFFTIPVKKLEEGLTFLSYAIRTPLMDKDRLELEKKIVLAEVEGRASSEGQFLFQFVQNHLFPENKWAVDVGGSKDVILNATVKQLKDIQKEFFIPNNCALFIGGDVNPAEIYETVNNIYGSWQAGDNPWTKKKIQFKRRPTSKTQYYVFKSEYTPKELINLNVFYRGPDSEYDMKDTYTADFLSSILKQQGSIFIKHYMSSIYYEIPSSEYLDFYYLSSKRLGVIYASSAFLSPNYIPAKRTKKFVSEIEQQLILSVEDAMKNDLTARKIIKGFENNILFEGETLESRLKYLKGWWETADSDYYFSYFKNISNVTKEDLKSYITKYIHNGRPIVVVSLNPEVFDNCVNEYKRNGFKVIEK